MKLSTPSLGITGETDDDKREKEPEKLLSTPSLGIT